MKTWVASLASLLLLASQASGLQMIFDGWIGGCHGDLEEDPRAPWLLDPGSRATFTVEATGYTLSYLGPHLEIPKSVPELREYILQLSSVRGRAADTSSGHVEWRMRGDDGRTNILTLRHTLRGEDYSIEGFVAKGKFLVDFVVDEFDSLGNLTRTVSVESPFFSVGVSRWYSGTSILDIPSRIELAPLHGGTASLFPVNLYVDSFTIIHDELTPGDANGDGTFDQRDIVQVASAGKYATAQLAPWSQGDWNADGLFDQLDLVAAQQAGGYRVAPQAARAVPEPSTLHICLTVFVMVSCSLLRRLMESNDAKG